MLARRLIEGMEAVVLTDTGEAIDGGSPDGRLGEADLRALAAAGFVIGADDQDGPRTLLDETDRAGLRNSLLADTGILATLDALWPPPTPALVVADLLGAQADGWSAADVPLLDEAAALIGQSNDRAMFGHVVVDVVQELSEMAWRMLMRRCPTRSMTIVGDLAQTGNPAGATSWDRVLWPHVRDRWQLAPLTVNYRTPAEIMAAALSLTTPPDLTGKVVLLTPDQAKGLEFDSVLIADPATILSAPLGHNNLYVAMTRATHRLGVVHPGPPPAELSAIREPKP